MIVGFPGETEEEFEHLCQFVQEMKFDRLGVFTYSKEDGTPASRLPEQDFLPEEVKEERANILMEIQKEMSEKEQISRFVGQVLDVLIERYDGRNDVYIGRSQYDAPEVDGEVYVSKSAQIGQIHKVRITHAHEYDLAGEESHESSQPDHIRENIF